MADAVLGDAPEHTGNGHIELDWILFMVERLAWWFCQLPVKTHSVLKSSLSYPRSLR